MSKPADQIANLLSKSAEIYAEEIRTALAYTGEECVKRAREDHPGNWTDRTGNLRSSIGYAVYEYGKEFIRSTFESVAGPTGTGSTGSAIGNEVIDSLAKEWSDTYALVVVAGMDYAEIVEDVHGRDVLAGVEAWATSIIDKRLERAKRTAEKRIQRLFN